MTVSTIGSFLITELSGVLFILFLQVILCWYGVTLAKLSPCLDKLETSSFSIQIFVSEGFSMWKLLLDKLVPGVDLDLYIVLTVSVFLEVSTVTLDARNLSVLSFMSIFFFSGVGDVLDSLTTFSLGFSYFSTV